MKDRNQFLSGISQKISAYICPVLLGTAICYAVIDVLDKEKPVLYSVIFLLEAWILFGVFDRLKYMKRLGGLLYIMVFIVNSLASSWLARMGMYRAGGFKELMKWFFGETDNYDQPYFLNALFIAGGFFLISILYYFTQVRYRSLGVMLCIMFPFVIYTKRVVIMPELMTTIIVVLYLAVIVHNRHIDPSRQEKNAFLKIDRSYIIAIAVFVSITGTVTMMIPKQSYVSFLEKNSDLFSYTNTIGGNGTGNSDNVSQESSSRYGERGDTGKILFRFRTDGNEGEYYLRKQPFDRFNGDIWEKDMNNINRYYYSEMYPEYEITDLVEDFYDIYQKDGLKLTEIQIERGFVEGEDFSASYLPCPLSTTVKDVSTSYYRKYLDDRVERMESADENLHNAFSFYEENGDLYEYAREVGLSSEEYEEILEENYGIGNVQKIYSDFLMARQLYSNTDGISTRIAELAEEITKEYHSDVEKAAALAMYFEENGYEYDEKYVPEDTSIEYFIFEGKKGICTNYATAMTLMARSIGLTARYVEGYAAFERDENELYIVRDSYAHAFVEVYIPAVGWMTFDPTVSGYMYVREEQHNYFEDIMQFLSHFVAVIAVAVFVLFVCLRDRIAELFFRISQIFRNPQKRTLKLYSNVIKLVNFSTGGDYRSYTVNMLREYLSSSRGAVPEKLLQLFEKTAFGGYVPDNSEYREAYAEYRKCYRFLRKIPKRKQA